ncbi:MAG: hypothetical protein ACKVHO_10595 [Verrucomicrobiia bacterium]
MIQSGFHWANPFYSKTDSKVSVRTRNFQSDKIKVNDFPPLVRKWTRPELCIGPIS